MNALEQRLADAASSDSIPPLHELLADLQLPDDASELLAAASGPLAPFACRASVQTVETTGSLEPDLLRSVLAGITQQSSLLALMEATDALLDSGHFVKLFGQQLCDAMLAGHANSLTTRPLIAAGHIEGALRLAMASQARPLKVLGALEFNDAEDLDSDYAERLPRLLGAALDRWADDPSISQTIRQSLISLKHLPDAAADATFEHGLDLLRQTAAAHDASAFELLLSAREQMGNAAAAEEARDDAALYAAGIDAVLAFTRADSGLLAASREEIARLLNRREAWLSGFYQPAWRRPRRDAERAWGSLLIILHSADEYLSETAWLDAWPALDAVLRAWRLDRGYVPVPGLSEASGFDVLIQPVVEERIVTQQAFIATLNRAFESARDADEPLIPAAQLKALNTESRR
ncbi:hypothetical protein ACFQO7_31030 [Catellatospora aurea]|uniref:DUF2336 domain-containing protein n=1 Tax=Catellatospora aurea TaxID=1337874 RepID=A0ABW2H8M0_9ACTN